MKIGQSQGLCNYEIKLKRKIVAFFFCGDRAFSADRNFSLFIMEFFQNGRTLFRMCFRVITGCQFILTAHASINAVIIFFLIFFSIFQVIFRLGGFVSRMFLGFGISFLLLGIGFCCGKVLFLQDHLFYRGCYAIP